MEKSSWQRCSANQNRYLVAEELSSNSYFLPISFVLDPKISVTRLKEAVQAVALAEPCLNVRFKAEAPGQFLFQTSPTPRIAIHEEKMGLASLGDAAPLIETFVYDQEGPLRGPACRVHIAPLKDGRTVFTIALHHAVADALSLGLFMDRVSSAYQQSQSWIAPDLPGFVEVATEYDLYTDGWNDDAPTFWQSALDMVAQETNTLPMMQTGGASSSRRTVHTVLDPQGFERLTEDARTLGVTVFELVFSAYLFVLARQTGSHAACATFQSSGRYGKPLAKDVIGVFSNALPVFAQIDPQKDFAHLSQDIRKQVKSALAHESLPYNEIIKATGYHPHFGINWYPVAEALQLEDLRIEGLRIAEWQSDFDLNLHCLPSGTGLTLNLSFRPEVLEQSRAQVILDHIVAMLDRHGVQAGVSVNDIALPGPDENIAAVLPTPQASSLYEAFYNNAHAHPDEIALLWTGGSWTYSELMEATDRLAATLSDQGITAGTKIVLHLERSAIFVALLLATTKLDAVFAIYDVDYPNDRVKKMDAVFGPAMRICAEQHQDSLHVSAAGQTVYLNKTGTDAHTVSPPQAAKYALFTSGTSGQPKCVLASGQGLLNFIKTHIEQNGFGPKTRFTLTGGLGHDPALRDIFTPLLSGATLAIPPIDFRSKPADFCAWLKENAINILHLTPQMSKLIALGAETKSFSDLRHIFWGGDVLRAGDVENFLTLAPNAQAWNLYGATETPQAATLFRITPPFNWSICPIGRAANGRKVSIVQNGRSAGYGEIGEIIVEGSDLALGYYDCKTGMSPFPHASETRTTQYATGDQGFITLSGDIMLVGRTDNQVKIRGYRVEPDEIVRILEQHAGVTQAAVLCDIGAGGENELIAYAATPDSTVDGAEILSACRRSLPSQMVPREVITLSRLPLTPNGKLDKSQLPSTSPNTHETAPDAAPQTDSERQIVTEIADLLNRSSVSVTACVRDLGVDSLSFLSLSMVLEKHVGALPARWDEIPLRELAQLQNEQSRLRPVETPVLMRALSIIAVVAGHFGVFVFGGGATSALFFIAGHSFGRFQATASAKQNSIAPILKIMGVIALPTLLYTLLVQGAFGALTPATWIFISNWIDPNLAGGFNAWFIEVLLQNLAILAVLFAVPQIRKFARQHPFELAVAFTITTFVLRFSIDSVWNTDPLYDRLPHHKIWLMGLGWGLVASSTPAQRIGITALAIALLSVDWLLLGEAPRPLTFVAFVLILAVSRVRLPYPLNTAISLVAGASLFIYLTHFQFKSVLSKLPDTLANDWLFLVGAIAGGVVLHYGWEKLIKFVQLKK